MKKIESHPGSEGSNMTSTRLCALALAALGFAGSCVPGSAQTGGDFYKGKQLSVMIGYGVGGSDDLWARLIARHIGDYIPGHPTVVPINAPGAGSLLLANQITNTQPKDGTVIGLINRGIPFEPLLGGISVRFDPLKLSFVGSPDRDTAVCAANKDSPVKTVQDLYTQELIVGATGSGADTEVYPSFLMNLLGMKFKIISGYPGSRAINLAIERGEVQGICVSYDTIARESIFKNGTVHVLFQAAVKPDPRLKEIPSAGDFAKTAQQHQALDLFLLRTNVGRPFIAPPGVPADRLAILRTAFEQTMKDPGLVQEAESAGLHPFYISPDELQKFVAEAYKMSPEVVALTKKALGH
jgi:tripartite-type tricarboxylate transporter receptor subunit TctC